MVQLIVVVVLFYLNYILVTAGRPDFHQISFYLVELFALLGYAISVGTQEKEHLLFAQSLEKRWQDGFLQDLLATRN